MEQKNRIELIGYTGNVRLSDVNGSQVANFSLVTNYVYKNKEGIANAETTWHNIVAWSGNGMPDFHRLDKGIPVRVIGRLRTRKYTNSENIEKEITEVAAYGVEILDEAEKLAMEQ